jgi:MFS transporter, DHA2 family, multidrug resistance protein
LVLGFALLSTSSIITTDVDFRTLMMMMMRTFQSAGLGFLLVPINTVAFLTLPRELNNDGAALFAMFQNIFGSIGISLAMAAITERTQVHQADLSRWTTPPSTL